jgi:hypothetical protein
MTVACPECGSVNKSGNKFCFECGFQLPTKQPSKPIPASEAKVLKLKKQWLKGEVSAEEYRARLLKMRLKDKFKHQEENE